MDAIRDRNTANYLASQREKGVKDPKWRSVQDVLNEYAGKPLSKKDMEGESTDDAKRKSEKKKAKHRKSKSSKESKAKHTHSHRTTATAHNHGHVSIHAGSRTKPIIIKVTPKK